MSLVVHTVNTTIAILVRLADHLVNLIVGELLTDRRHDVTKLGCGNEAVVVTIEYLEAIISKIVASMGSYVTNLESLANLLLGIGVLHLPGHHGEELCR